MTDDELKARLERIEAAIEYADNDSGCVPYILLCILIVVAFKGCGG